MPDNDKVWKLLEEMTLILMCEKKPRGYRKFLARWRRDAYALLKETERIDF